MTARIAIQKRNAAPNMGGMESWPLSMYEPISPTPKKWSSARKREITTINSAAKILKESAHGRFVTLRTFYLRGSFAAQQSFTELGELEMDESDEPDFKVFKKRFEGSSIHFLSQVPTGKEQIPTLRENLIEAQTGGAALSLERTTQLL